MAFVRWLAGNEGPVNDGERRAIEYLRQHLPDDFELFPNLTVAVDHGDMTECDVLVLGPDCMWLLEIKDFAGTVSIGANECRINGEARPHPVIKTRGNAQRIKTRLSREDEALRGIWIQHLVVLAREPRQLDLAPVMRHFVGSLQTSVSYIIDPTLVGRQAGRLSNPIRDRIKNCLSLVSTARSDRPKYGPYATLRLVRDAGEVLWWEAEHEVLKTPVLLEVVRPDYLLNEADQKARRGLAQWPIEVRRRVGQAPFFHLPHDAWNADDGSIVIIHSLPSTPTLEDLHQDIEDLSEEKRRRIVGSFAAALAILESRGIVHGSIGPSCIFISELGSVKLGGFSNFGLDKSRSSSRQPGGIDPIGPNAFRSPEHGEGPATFKSDLFALGCLIRLLWQQGIPQDLADIAERATQQNPAERDVTAREVADLLTPRRPEPAVGRRALESGSILGGRYELERLISKGESSSIWKATDQQTSFSVALKIYSSEDASESAQREYKAMESVSHPNIVKVRHFGKIDEYWVVVSEYLDGPNLRFAMPPAVSPFAIEQAVSMTLHLLSALQTIHPNISEIVELSSRIHRTDVEEIRLDELRREGVTHRDIRPDNIILVGSERPVLVDFGLAASGDVGVAGGAREYRPAGAALESADPDVDLFALGVILHQVLTGKHPYADSDPSTGLLQLSDSLNDGIRRVLSRACSPKFEERFRSASEFSAALVALGLDTVPLPMPPLDAVAVMHSIQDALVLGDWDKAIELCPAGWVDLLRRIEERRELAELAGGQIPLLEIEGFTLRYLESRDFDSAQSAGAVTVGPGTIRVYRAAGPNGENLDIGYFISSCGERWVHTIDVYETPLPLKRLAQGLRIGIHSFGSELKAELRQARISGPEMWSSAFKASESEISLGAGGDVREIVKPFGASGYGTQEEVFGDRSPRRGYMCAVFPPYAEDLPAVLYFLTRVMPLAQGVPA